MFGPGGVEMLKTVPADTADGSASSPQPARHPAVADAMIARQPILDLQKRLHGYGLVCCDTAPASDVTDSPARQARLTIHHVMHVMGFDALVGGARAYIRVAPDNLLRQEYAVLPPERTVLELDEPGEGEGDWLDLCRGATEAGYRLAVNRDPGRPRAGSWLPGVEAVKFDMRAIDSAACQSVLPELKRRGITAIAAHVETQEAFRRAASLGFDLVQGYFFCEPEVITRRTLLSNQAVCLHLLAELAKPTLDLARIEAVVKSDVALSIALLRYLNSAAMGLGHRIDSIRQALVMLGERPLRRWGFLASIHALGKGKPHQLLLTALVRARFCE